MSARKLAADKLLWQMVGRWKRSSPELDRIQFLKTVPFFDRLSNRQLKSVSDIMFERTYDTDESIFEEGQPGAALFLILQGKVAIEICREAGTTRLAVLESTGPVAASWRLSGCSITLPSHQQSIRFLCPWSLSSSVVASSSTKRSLCKARPQRARLNCPTRLVPAVAVWESPTYPPSYEPHALHTSPCLWLRKRRRATPHCTSVVTSLVSSTEARTSNSGVRKGSSKWAHSWDVLISA